MRRLHQAIVCAVALASLLGFVIYKHEYDRLSNLLHVLNTFGYDSSRSSMNSQDFDSPSESESAVGRPLYDVWAGWQSVGGNSFVYSAFADAATPTVNVIGMVPRTVAGAHKSPSGCLLWFGHDPVPRRGQLVTLASPGASAWRGATFTCNQTETSPGGRWPPYAVSLTTGDHQPGNNNTFVPMTYVRGAENLPRNTTEILRVCATIRSPHTEPRLLAQFVTFHHYVGVKLFTFYDLGTDPVLHRLIRRLRRTTTATIQVLPWNMPAADDDDEVGLSVKNFVRRDCLARHASVPFVVLTDVNRVLVPKLHSHLTNLLRDENDLSKQALGLVHLTERAFCLDAPDSPFLGSSDSASFPIFHKTSWIERSRDSSDASTEIVAPRAVDVFAAPGSDSLALRSGFRSRHIGEDVAVVHSYENCSAYPQARVNFDNLIARKFRYLRFD